MTAVSPTNASNAAVKAHHSAVLPESVRLGKDVIELLTTAMYASPLTIFREYVQNAADAIDALRAVEGHHEESLSTVSIAFDHNARSVAIYDRGIGIASKDIEPVLLAVGASSKRGTSSRGFRGVGRLSGLAYCQALTFRTKAAGENRISSVTWNCAMLREHLRDSSYRGDLRSLIADVVDVSFETVVVDIEDHFFEVKLTDVARLRGDMLLNEQLVSEYLSQVAPLNFSPEFSFGAEIQQCVVGHTAHKTINLEVGGKEVWRPYADLISYPKSRHTIRISDVEYFELLNVDGGIGAVGWLANHEYLKGIPSVLRISGLRARCKNLQVGDPSIFDGVFKEPRFNSWSIGELHIIDPRIVPNARRDDFEVNHHYYNILVQLGPVATKITQYCRKASIARNAEQACESAIADAAARLRHSKSLDRAEISRMRAAFERAEAKLPKVRGESRRVELARNFKRLHQKLQKLRPKRRASVVALDQATTLISRVVTNRELARRLLAELSKLTA